MEVTIFCMVDVEVAGYALPFARPSSHTGNARLARIVLKLRRSDHLCPNVQAALDILARPAGQGRLCADRARPGLRRGIGGARPLGLPRQRSSGAPRGTTRSATPE